MNLKGPMSNDNPIYDFLVIEAISKRLRELQRQEAMRQDAGNVDPDTMVEYDKLPENIKEFYRVLARHMNSKIEGAVETLKFYGEPDNWLEVSDSGVKTGNVFDDMGKRANKALDDLGFGV